MVATFQNSAMVLSIGVFFTLIITGLASSLPHAMFSGLVAQGVPRHAALAVSTLPPTSTMFAALLGYNPMKTLLAPVLPHLSHTRAAYLVGRSFFPALISKPFGSGLDEALFFGMAALLLAAGASWLRGGKYHYREPAETPADATQVTAGDDSDRFGGTLVPAGVDGANGDAAGPSTPDDGVRNLPAAGRTRPGDHHQA